MGGERGVREHGLQEEFEEYFAIFNLQRVWYIVNEVCSQVLFFSSTHLVLEVTKHIFQMCVGSKLTHNSLLQSLAAGVSSALTLPSLISVLNSDI